MELTIQCPTGASPGCKVNFTLPDGRRAQVQVPRGVSAGQTFKVRIQERSQEEMLLRQTTSMNSELDNIAVVLIDSTGLGAPKLKENKSRDRGSLLD